MPIVYNNLSNNMENNKFEPLIRAANSHRYHESNVLGERGISFVESICLFDKLTRPKDTVDLVLGIKPDKINNINLAGIQNLTTTLVILKCSGVFNGRCHL